MRRACAVALAIALGCAAVATAAPPPVEAFGRLPAVSDVDINPAGTRLVWIDNAGALPRIVIYDLVRKGEVRSIRIPRETVPREVYWADDKTILLGVTTTHSESGARRERREWQRWFSIDLFEDSPRMLLTRMGFLEWNRTVGVMQRRASKPGKILMSGWDFRNAYVEVTHNLYEVDLKTGDGRMLERGSALTDEWAVDPTGAVAVRSELDVTRDRFSILVRDGREWRRIYDSRVCGKLWSTSIAADRSALIALGRACDDARIRLWSLPLDGSAMKAVIEDPVLDVEELIVDATNQTILGARLAGNDRPERWLNEVEGQRLAALRRSFGTQWISVTARTRNNQRIVVRVEGPAHPPIVHLVDYESKRADVINEMYPGLSGVSIGTVSEFRYQSRDDYPLVARLTVPPGSDGKNLPLVVLPHDGPEDRDADVFDWEAQFLASRGYAVIQPQYRGSTGLGQAHADAGRRQWGLRMQDDVTDAGRAAIARGIADPKRICIAGHGYGGYVALAGATFTPEMYACAASISGISDLPFMLGHIKRLSWSDDSSYVTYWRKHIGNVSDGPVAVYSPARSAANVRIPILLMHGEDDTTVPIVQSEVMVRALKEAGKSHEFIELPDEDHWMSKSATRIRMLSELEKFLAKNLASTAMIN